MVPPYKGFGQLQHMNKAIHHDTWRRTRAEGISLAQFCAEIARAQCVAGRHFVLEQPLGGDMFAMPMWEQLAREFPLVKCHFDQCRVGLRMSRHPYLPVRKPTVLVSSHEGLVIVGLGINNVGVNTNIPQSQAWPINPSMGTVVWPRCGPRQCVVC